MERSSVPPAPRARVRRAFAAAELVAWVGGAVTGAVVRAGETVPQMLAQTLVHLLFGWPVALAALFVAAIVHTIVRRTCLLRRSGAMSTGALVGALAIAAWGDAAMIAWCAVVGALAGAVWWRVALGRRVLDARAT